MLQREKQYKMSRASSCVFFPQSTLPFPSLLPQEHLLVFREFSCLVGFRPALLVTLGRTVGWT